MPSEHERTEQRTALYKSATDYDVSITSPTISMQDSRLVFITLIVMVRLEDFSGATDTERDGAVERGRF